MKNPDVPGPLPFGGSRQTSVLLREVSVLASTAIRVSRERPLVDQTAQQDEDDLQDRIQLLRQTLARIGWVADVALRRMGEGGSFATAEDWMLPGH